MSGTQSPKHTLHLDFHQPLHDGSRISFLGEVVVVDSRHDPPLSLFLSRLRTFFDAAATPADAWACVDTVAQQISWEFGGFQEDGDVAESRWQAKVRSLETEEVHIGILFVEPGISDGAGLSHHKAILLKYCCDQLGIAPCALWSAAPKKYAWNFIRIGSETVRMDPMAVPPSLLDGVDECDHVARDLGDPQVVTYLVDNSCLATDADGLAFRLSMNIDDRAEQVATWGTIVYGTRADTNWLKVGDAFLPLSLQNIPVLLNLDEVAKQCPKSHVLARFLVKKAGEYFCNICKVHPKQGSIMFGCEVCDFDLCGKCAVVNPRPGHEDWLSSAHDQQGLVDQPGRQTLAPERKVCQDWLPFVFTCAPWKPREGLDAQMHDYDKNAG